MSHRLIEGHRNALVRLAGLEQSEIDELGEVLRTTKPSLEREQFTARVAKQLDLEFETVEEIVAFLCEAYATLDYVGLRVEELIEQLRPSLGPWAEDADVEPSSPTRILSFLTRALECHHSVGVTAKAIDLWFEQERIYCSSRIVTDLRPIFQPQLKGEPTYYLTSHDLRITYHPDGRKRTEDVHIALTYRDLLRLREVVDRALSKEEKLVETSADHELRLLSDVSREED